VAIYALLVYSEVQGKVHMELDHIVGHDHPPRAEDQIRMPYLEAGWRGLFGGELRRRPVCHGYFTCR
jgi:hypothetical protein